jgi:glycosyltransferase involved in cell wall biosynthesis
MSHAGDADPLVTVVTPAYNRARYLAETIESVLSQDYPRIEYIVLDDGSTDDTRAVLSRYGDRIRWESHPNMGQTRTVNRGFSMARGDFVAVVNSDDPLLPGAIRAAVDAFRGRPDALVAYPDWLTIDGDSKPVRTIRVREYDYRFMVRRFQCIVGPGAFIRREAVQRLGGWNAEYRFIGDFDFWLRLGLVGPFVRTPHVTATFRVHAGSASVAKQGQALAQEPLRVARNFFARPDLPPAIRRLRRESMSWAFYYAGLAAGPPRALAWGYYVKAVATHPVSAPAKWRLLVLLLTPRRLQSRVRALWWRAQALVRRVPV